LLVYSLTFELAIFSSDSIKILRFAQDQFFSKRKIERR